MRRHLAAQARPGIVVSITTSGDLIQWHPHAHLLLSDGAFSDDGTFHPLENWDGDTVMRLFRERLLARLIGRRAISEELAHKLLKWRHPGFSAHVGEPIPFEDNKAIEDVASYLVKAPLSLKKLVYRRARVNRARLIWRDHSAIPGLDGQKAVVYRSKMNPALGRNFEAMDPLEWLARLADHIPDTGRHRTHLYGFYSSRVRSRRRQTDGSSVPAEPSTKRRCAPSWARLISRVYQADPLVCKRCGGPLAIVAYITGEVAIRRILEHLELSPPQQERSPPRPELVRVPVNEQGREIQAS
jgi:hypothetical protein